jgi:hypothetical protein
VEFKKKADWAGFAQTCADISHMDLFSTDIDVFNGQFFLLSLAFLADDS